MVGSPQVSPRVEPSKNPEAGAERAFRTSFPVAVCPGENHCLGGRREPV